MKKINILAVFILFLLTGQAQTRYCSKYAGHLYQGFWFNGDGR